MLTVFFISSQTIFVMGCISYSDLTYKRKTVLYEYPSWGIAVGWGLASISIIFIPIIMVYRILTTRGTLVQVCAVLRITKEKGETFCVVLLSVICILLLTWHPFPPPPPPPPPHPFFLFLFLFVCLFCTFGHLFSRNVSAVPEITETACDDQ